MTAAIPALPIATERYDRLNEQQTRALVQQALTRLQQIQSDSVPEHTHAIADVTGLQTALDGKAASSHNHAATDINSGTLADARLSSNVPLLNAAANAFTGDMSVGGLAYTPLHDAGNSSTSKTIDWQDSNLQKVTLTGNCTLSYADAQDGAVLTLILVQDGTGSRTVTWPSGTKWPGGTDAVLSTAAGSIDVLTVVKSGADYYTFFSGKGMAA